VSEEIQRERLGDWDWVWDPILEEMKSVAGVICEFGCYEGGNTIRLAGHGREVLAFDTFEGMPSQEFHRDLDRDEPGKFKPRYPVGVLYSAYPNIKPQVGRFVDTLPQVDKDTLVVLAYVDCDLYESHKQCLDWLTEHLVPQGAVVFDDYRNLKGAAMAIDEWRGKWNLQIDREKNLVRWRGV
jgi:hypothetical protein